MTAADSFCSRSILLTFLKQLAAVLAIVERFNIESFLIHKSTFDIRASGEISPAVSLSSSHSRSGHD